MKGKESFYNRYVKRMLDIVCAVAALSVFSPLFIILMAAGSIVMKGNPFFFQERPGRNEKIFRLIKFRTMSNEKDSAGELLPDEKRLNGYGRFLRSSSLDELPEAVNILLGDMSVVGPRPWLVEYLPLYSETQHHRHDVRPGLSGWAQIHGRNEAPWEERIIADLWYVENISFALDVRIVLKTIGKFVRREGISSETSDTMERFKGTVNG